LLLLCALEEYCGGGAAKTGPRSTKPWQDPDLWTCPVNPHLMCIWRNIYLFIYSVRARDQRFIICSSGHVASEGAEGLRHTCVAVVLHAFKGFTNMRVYRAGHHLGIVIISDVHTIGQRASCDECLRPS
jgi:hypothetical protein